VSFWSVVFLLPHELSEERVTPACSWGGGGGRARAPRLLIESPWLQFASEYPRFAHPPRLNHSVYLRRLRSRAAVLRWIRDEVERLQAGLQTAAAGRRARQKAVEAGVEAQNLLCT
jgi:hypothetical protein